MAKNITQPETPELFTVYYMNQEKVFEMRMLLDNRLPKEHRGERVSSTAGEADIDVQTDAAMPFLAKLQGSITGSIGHEKQDFVRRYIESVTTKYQLSYDALPCPGDIATATLGAIDVSKETNIRILKNLAREWFVSYVEKRLSAPEGSS